MLHYRSFSFKTSFCRTNVDPGGWEGYGGWIRDLLGIQPLALLRRGRIWRLEKRNEKDTAAYFVAAGKKLTV